MARPALKTKTEQSMYARLHRDVDTFRGEWSIPERNTPFARATIARWANEGILETQELHPGRSYRVLHYRLAPEWRDESMASDLLLEDLAAVDEGEAAQTRLLDDATTRLTTAWEQLGAIARGPLPEADALNDAAGAAMNFHSAMMHVRSTQSNLERLRARRGAIEAKLSARMAIPAGAPAGGDPLGGDA